MIKELRLLQIIFLFSTFFIFINTLNAQTILIKEGQYSSGITLYNFDGKILRLGEYSSGEAICNWDGKVLRLKK